MITKQVDLSKCVDHGRAIGEFSPGYAQVTVGGKKFYAHRLAAYLYCGLDLQDTTTVVRHLCGNTRCINPQHLALGSPADNMRDSSEAGRCWGGQRADGEHNPKAKLTWEKVRAIRKECVPHKRGEYIRLAAIYGVTRETISGIVKRRFWIEEYEMDKPG